MRMKINSIQRQGILGAIELLSIINHNRSDRETHELIKQIIYAMEHRKRRAWPSKNLRKHVNQLNDSQRKLFIDTLKDMDEALTEHFENNGEYEDEQVKN